jgi:endonuclease/exonuclease/phosphatase family metal-dependent hydrolase
MRIRAIFLSAVASERTGICMRLMVYNIRYGTGGKRLLFPWSGYLRRTTENLRDMAAFVQAEDPDIVGLLEVDRGSYRSERMNQAEILARLLGHYHIGRTKYHRRSMANQVPVLNKQGNAFLTRDTIQDQRFHYFEKGMKKLVIELEMSNLIVFLVHLALGFRARHHQLDALYALVKEARKPVIVAGDFNAPRGGRELRLFMAATTLESANQRAVPTFPSWRPRRQLDFILYSKAIQVQRFWMPHVTFSDHLPLLLDFEVATAT